MKKYFNNFLLLVAVIVVCNFLILDSSHSRELFLDKTFICQEDLNIVYFCPRDTDRTLEKCNFKKKKYKRKGVKIKIKKKKDFFPEATTDREGYVVGIAHSESIQPTFYFSDEINFINSNNLNALKSYYNPKNTDFPNQDLSSFQFEVYKWVGSRYTEAVHQQHSFALRSGFCELE